jgi:putative SOS response-associated peptidase YedK
MCTNYKPSSRELVKDYFQASPIEGSAWPDETYQDYPAPIILPDRAGRIARAANYSMVPKSHIPPGVKRYSTMNARAETIGQLRSYSSAWKAGQLCLVPMTVFFEPNWETGVHERWQIGMADGSPFAVAGLWRTWDEADGTTLYAFTQLTINADEHALMRRFHKPGEEKRSLVIVPHADYDDWLNCHDSELARSFLQPYPAELMTASPAPRKTRAGSAAKKTVLASTQQASLDL